MLLVDGLRWRFIDFFMCVRLGHTFIRRRLQVLTRTARLRRFHLAAGLVVRRRIDLRHLARSQLPSSRYGVLDLLIIEKVLASVPWARIGIPCVGLRELRRLLRRKGVLFLLSQNFLSCFLLVQQYLQFPLFVIVSRTLRTQGFLQLTLPFQECVDLDLLVPLLCLKNLLLGFYGTLHDVYLALPDQEFLAKPVLLCLGLH